VDLVLTVGRDACVIEIADDGAGFREEAPGDATRRGLGLEGMKLRAEEMRGTVTWERSDNGGTRVVIRFPRGQVLA
jgi:signal transduction histidine kinase